MNKLLWEGLFSLALSLSDRNRANAGAQDSKEGQDPPPGATALLASGMQVKLANDMYHNSGSIKKKKKKEREMR